MAEPDGGRYAAAVAAIEAANAEDPTTTVVHGVEGPRELLHGRLAVVRLLELDPDADELRLLAARAHHLRRWTMPRSDHPDGRAGYLRWRSAARRRHAEEVRDLLAGCGYDDAERDRVAAVVAKEGLGTDPHVQAHEDALCLVFLEVDLSDVAGRLGDDATVRVLARTLRKMSDRGRRAALEVPLDPRASSLLRQALAGDHDDGAAAPGTSE